MIGHDVFLSHAGVSCVVEMGTENRFLCFHHCEVMWSF